MYKFNKHKCLEKMSECVQNMSKCIRSVHLPSALQSCACFTARTNKRTRDIVDIVDIVDIIQQIWRTFQWIDFFMSLQWVLNVFSKVFSSGSDVSLYRACPRLNIPTGGDGVPLTSLDGRAIGVGLLLACSRNGTCCDFVTKQKKNPKIQQSLVSRPKSSEMLRRGWPGMGMDWKEQTVQASCSLRYNPSILMSSNRTPGIDPWPREPLAKWRSSSGRTWSWLHDSDCNTGQQETSWTYHCCPAQCSPSLPPWNYLLQNAWWQNCSFRAHHCWNRLSQCCWQALSWNNPVVVVALKRSCLWNEKHWSPMFGRQQSNWRHLPLPHHSCKLESLTCSCAE